MSDYTPTTDEVRGIYNERVGNDIEFDRWLADHERKVAERAWLEGHAAGIDYQGDGWNSDAHDPALDNPYRADATESEVRDG